jgi:hypothetical protein
VGLRDVRIIVFVLGSKGFNQDICLEFTCASSYSSKLDMGCTAHEVDAKVRLSMSKASSPTLELRHTMYELRFSDFLIPSVSFHFAANIVPHCSQMRNVLSFPLFLHLISTSPHRLPLPAPRFNYVLVPYPLATRRLKVIEFRHSRRFEGA